VRRSGWLIRFFRRGAWLALFHGFAAADMHQENMIASGDDPVPIDLEMLLQASADEQSSGDPEAMATEAAKEIIANSVSAVGLLPAYGRSPQNQIVALGGMNADWNARMKLALDGHQYRQNATVQVKGSESHQPESAAF